jgi:[ribosomal protein S18]-alanine N-acetyltransferase
MSEATTRIDLMQLSDLERVVEIENVSFSLPWTISVFIDQLKLGDYAWSVCMRRNDNDEIIGYAIFWFAAEEVHLMNIAVCDQHRGQGYGDTLLRGILHLARVLKADRIVLEVRVSNAAAIGLYEKYDFRKATVRQGYYSDTNEDAYLMILEPLAWVDASGLELDRELMVKAGML